MAQTQGVSKDHLVYIPEESIGLNEIITRAASMVCGLPYWNVSVRLEEDHDPTQIAGLVRLTVGNMKLMMPFLTAHRDALFRGLPLTKNMKPLADEEEEAEFSHGYRRPFFPLLCRCFLSFN